MFFNLMLEKNIILEALEKRNLPYGVKCQWINSQRFIKRGFDFGL
jgi:hypothetical protein